MSHGSDRLDPTKLQALLSTRPGPGLASVMTGCERSEISRCQLAVRVDEYHKGICSAIGALARVYFQCLMRLR